MANRNQLHKFHILNIFLTFYNRKKLVSYENYEDVEHLSPSKKKSKHQDALLQILEEKDALSDNEMTVEQKKMEASFWNIDSELMVKDML